MLIPHNETPSTFRGFGVAIVVLLTGLTMAGCGGNSAGTAKPRASKNFASTAKPQASTTTVPAMAAAPKVGDCWQNSPALIQPLTWEGKAAVPCTQNHNAFTFLVGTLPNGTTWAKIEADSLKSVEAVTDSCNYKTAQANLGQAPPYAVLRFTVAFFAPTKAQWAAGARWYRCDLGSPDNLWDPKLALQWRPLPANIRAAVAKDATPYRNCSTGSQMAGPASTGAITGKCGQGAQWVLIKIADLAKKPGEAYPGAQATERRGQAACPMPSARRKSSWPSASEWKADNTSAWCWEWRTGPA